MRTVKTLLSSWLFLAILVALLGWLTTAPTRVYAQNCTVGTCKGWNGVYGNLASQVPGYAFVDAAPYMSDSRCPNGGCDICDSIGLVLTDYNHGNSNGVVIDARGVPTPQTCTSGTSRFPNPWSAIPAQMPYANIVLLPPGTINLQQTWVLPTDTRIIGEGPNLTTIQPCTLAVCGQAFTSSTDPDLIDMGLPTVCSDCIAVVIEHLGLNGGNMSGINGIVNSSSQELSYVDDVALINIAGTGLILNIGDSGPYSNIYYSGTGICANIAMTVSHSRGIHGLTCIMSGSTPPTPAVYVDGSNNTLEDVYLQGGPSQNDGILVGANAAASNNVLFNVRGSGFANLVHISTANSSSDITVLGATNLGTPGTNTIEDDLTSPHTQITDTNVAMYIVGEQVQSGSSNVGYSRFTTSQSIPTWLVGPNSPGSASCAIGSLYSATSGSSGTLFGCRGNSGGGSWNKIN